MRAVVLAAGTGSRLGAHTAQRPKCLVELQGRPLLDWQLDALAAAGITDVTLVTGYMPQTLAGRGTRQAHNPDFATTNMVASLVCARDSFDGSDDVLIAYGDIVYAPRLVAALHAPRTPVAVAVDTEWLELWSQRMPDPLADAETLKIDPAGNLVEIGRKPTSYDDIEAQYIGLIVVRADFAGEFVARYDTLGPERATMYMTDFLQGFVDSGSAVGAVRVAGGWIEVDTPDDLAFYEALAADGRLAARVELGGL